MERKWHREFRTNGILLLSVDGFCPSGLPEGMEQHFSAEADALLRFAETRLFPLLESQYLLSDRPRKRIEAVPARLMLCLEETTRDRDVTDYTLSYCLFSRGKLLLRRQITERRQNADGRLLPPLRRSPKVRRKKTEAKRKKEPPQKKP